MAEKQLVPFLQTCLNKLREGLLEEGRESKAWGGLCSERSTEQWSSLLRPWTSGSCAVVLHQHDGNAVVTTSEKLYV